MDYKLRVVQVTNNPDDYPELAEASAAFPELVEHINDADLDARRMEVGEVETFVVDPISHDFWPASEFFYVCGVTAFLVYMAELP